MKEMFEKISSYNLFNNFLPGLLFCLVTPYVSKYSLVQTDIISGFFLYYFVGIIIGRIGSIMIEPALRKMAKFIEYDKYVRASKVDLKIELFSEINNSYRNYISVIISLFVWSAFSKLSSIFLFLNEFRFMILGIVIVIILVFSFRKQTAYIKKRVETVLKE